MTRHNHERTYTATHEAGHAVAYFHLDITLERVTIRPGGGMDGYVLVAGYVGDPVGALKQVLAVLAGYAALIAAGYDHEEAREGACADFRDAGELLTTWALPGTLGEWQAVAASFMNTPENIAAVDLIASALLEHETLEGDYVGALIEKAAGLPEHIWRQFVAWKYPDML